MLGEACSEAQAGQRLARQAWANPVARIPYADLDKADPKVREMLGRLPAPANIFTMLADAPTCLKPVMKLGARCLASCS
jgi:hypothetical protein